MRKVWNQSDRKWSQNNLLKTKKTAFTGQGKLCEFRDWACLPPPNTHPLFIPPMKKLYYLVRPGGKNLGIIFFFGGWGWGWGYYFFPSSGFFCINTMIFVSCEMLVVFLPLYLQSFTKLNKTFTIYNGLILTQIRL